MYYGARYYLPNVARFISADTVVPSIVNPQALNRYSYAFNSPITFADPSGHAPEDCVDGPIADCSEEDSLIYGLAQYGVAVIFESTITDTDQRIQALKAIETAVLGYAAKLIDLGTDFQTVMGATQFRIYDQDSLNKIDYVDESGNEQSSISHNASCDGRTNCTLTDTGIYGVNHNKTNGVYDIELTLPNLLGSGPAEGANLVAHELGHNLTWQNKTIDSAAAWDEKFFFGVDADSIHGNPNEESADAFASWALDIFDEQAINDSGLTYKGGNPLDVDAVKKTIGCAAVPGASGCGG